MVDLNDIAVFVKVAQLESFSRAARALSMPVSTVSRRVTALEEQLGVTLLQRTTRKLSLTAQGRAYYDQCSEPLNHLNDAESVLTRGQRRPEGLLRISVPVVVGQEPFYDFLSAFLTKYLEIKVDVLITNVFLDLIAENVDAAVRFGELADSTLVAQRIGKSIRYLVASPAYVQDHGAPKRPEDLLSHQCILLNGRNNEAEWHLVNGEQSVRLHVAGAIAVHDVQSIRAFACRGHGIGLLPSHYCDDQIANGDLVRVLPDWSPPTAFVHLVYPTRRFLPSKLQVFLQELKNWKNPAWTPLR
ncbi:LysR family transcriptional regulator [Rhizobium grahamii]|uniref:HTH-type transcriptional regulator TtuA n=1 Tax=Rhizobium grahamii TaxID=1120045 RepID=A0A370KVA3_9HYPH|nr:LysR family transcriptional regulator [Rhizobium grahamii]RDJ15444.1 LysR family transcriptional regulator [Rhizobium grahamii]